MFSIETVADLLHEHKQRATYGAVAGLLGVPSRSLMQNYTKGRRFSWIVNQKTGLPTDYAPSQIDPDLKLRPKILATEAELVQWLRSLGA